MSGLRKCTNSPNIARNNQYILYQSEDSGVSQKSPFNREKVVKKNNQEAESNKNQDIDEIINTSINKFHNKKGGKMLRNLKESTRNSNRT